jgi:hypothetical protein
MAPRTLPPGRTCSPQFPLFSGAVQEVVFEFPPLNMRRQSVHGGLWLFASGGQVMTLIDARLDDKDTRSGYAERSLVPAVVQHVPV